MSKQIITTSPQRHRIFLAVLPFSQVLASQCRLLSNTSKPGNQLTASLKVSRQSSESSCSLCWKDKTESPHVLSNVRATSNAGPISRILSGGFPPGRLFL